MIELQKKAIEHGIDTKSIEKRMGDMSDNVIKANDDDFSATITGAFTDKLGRTEVIMGNSEAAQKGNLSRSQKGEKNNTLLIIAIIVGTLILIALIASK